MCLVYGEIKLLSGLSPICRYLLKTVMTVINNDDTKMQQIR